MSSVTPEQLDAVLPQTQCGLCGHGGCMPYAEAMVFEKAAVNLCPPGGVTVLKKLGDLLQQDVSSYEAEMQAKHKPPLLAVIRENECIGCTKCIKACPVDAIIGSAKLMHSVISDECTGCELCIPACPVDCISLVPATPQEPSKADHYRTRFQAREKRLQEENRDKRQRLTMAADSERKKYLDAVIERTRSKKANLARSK